ncbi:hypothetical protein BpHYR1_012640 [Brachionus plicatilis]|uniref:SWIM-type domain-containing protein n=1 Tax=Brachionus plicatilis TaxID=10195 RepID=A0A3M7SV54_BRAPC|nr:hypothetical protein BpHYR1_012640 [Brachionus plicatilis]
MFIIDLASFRFFTTILYIDNFKLMGKRSYIFNGYYTLNTKENTCSCKYFVKYAYCSHLMTSK